MNMQICLCPILFGDIVAIPLPNTKWNLYLKMVYGIKRLRSSWLLSHVDCYVSRSVVLLCVGSKE